MMILTNMLSHKQFSQLAIFYIYGKSVHNVYKYWPRASTINETVSDIGFLSILVSIVP